MTRPHVALFDYGAGNLHSLAKGLEAGGARVSVTADWGEALSLDALVLPGVGSFGAAAEALAGHETRVREALEEGLPCLGICLGMQLLFPASEEGRGAGIGLVPGRVRRLRAAVVPQMGWNDVEPEPGADPLFPSPAAVAFYFANSYVCEPVDEAVIVASAEYEGTRFAAAVRAGRSWGVQFHPEKSSGAGLALLRAFLEQIGPAGPEAGRVEGSAAGAGLGVRSGAGAESAAGPAAGPSTTSPRARPFTVLPAVDLRGGRCVQLVGGRPDRERVSLPDPVAVARGWREKGFRALHVVDLDAALDEGDNLRLIEAIAREAPGELQVGGGIRDDERAAALLRAGADRIVVGTRAIDDPAWLDALARRHPGAVVVAADVRDGVVLRKGWTEGSGIRVLDFLARLRDLPLAGVLCTDVGREGRVEGIDREAAARVLAASPHPVWISGGVTTVEELRFLAHRGAAGAVLGMALYTGRLDASDIAREL